MTSTTGSTTRHWAQLSRASQVNVAGMLSAVVGIVIQIAAGVDYPTIPPGPILLAVASGLIVFGTRRWVLIAGVIVPLFLLVGGTIASFAKDNLWDPAEPAQFAGLLIQALGQATALLAGVLAVRARWSR
jgi:hypothetical protein